MMTRSIFHFALTTAVFGNLAHADLKIEVVDDTNMAGPATDTTSPYLLLVGKAAGNPVTQMSVSVPPGGELASIKADVTYTPAEVSVEIGNGAVTSIALVSGMEGAGYQATGDIPVSFSGGLANAASGTPATGTATVAGGIITALNLVSGGSGYASKPTVSVPNSMIPKRINQLPPAGYSVTPPYSGISRPVHYFTANTIGSGALMIFGNEGTGSSPFVYSDNVNPSPTTSNFRFDQCELTYNATIQTGANMTTIDQMGFPMRLEVFDSQSPSDANKVGERIFYGPISEILSQFSSGLGSVLYKKGASAPASGWTPADGMSQFLRALGPGQVAANSPTGDPAPYPSFIPTLAAMKTSQPTTVAAGTVAMGNYGVQSVTVSAGGSGYTSGQVVVTATGGTLAPGGSAASLFAQVNGSGVIVGVLVNENGQGDYTVAPTGITFTPQAGYGGTGASASPTTGQAIDSVTITDGGSGYGGVAPAITFTGGSGKGAVAYATLDVSGDMVTGVTVLNKGAGYTSPPNVAFSDFNISGSANSVDYNYAGNIIDSPDGNGYKIVLNGTTFATGTTTPSGGQGLNAAGNPVTVPADAELTVNLPASIEVATATANLGEGSVDSVNITTAGEGYTSLPDVQFTGGGGSGASGTAVGTEQSGAYTVTDVHITNAGTGYTSAPTLTFINGGTPTTEPVTEVVVSYKITGITLTHDGKGYMSTPVVTIEGPTLAGGTTATATAAISDATGKVTALSIGDMGSGYISENPPDVTVDRPGGSADGFLYGATLNADSFWVAGYPRENIRKDTNISYGAMTRDVLAAINFGFIGGKLGNTGAEWYSTIPNDSPFGAARTQNMGDYNIWAAMIYNYSDAYGFAFSDKVNPSPLINLPVDGTLRITILPDDWLKAPCPTVTGTGNDSITLEWASVAGATSYELTIIDPAGYDPVTYNPGMTTGTQTFTLENGAENLNLPLQPETTYSFTVSAVNGSKKTASYPMQAVTGGTYAPVSGAYTFLATLSYIPPDILLQQGAFTAMIGGQKLYYQPDTKQWNDQLNGGSPVTLSIAADTTQSYPLSILLNDKVVFSTNLEVTSNSSGIVTAASYFMGGANGTLTPGATLTANFPPLEPLKEFAPVLGPPTTYAGWLLQNPELTDTGMGEDQDQDGYTNLLEYFMGMDPVVPGFFGNTSSEKTDDFLKFSYLKSKSQTGVDEQVEWSIDLTTWSSGGVTYDADKDENGHIIRTARVAVEADQTLFIRLKLSEK